MQTEQRYEFTVKAQAYGIDDDEGETVDAPSYVWATSKSDARRTISECLCEILEEAGVCDFPIQRAQVLRVTWES